MSGATVKKVLALAISATVALFATAPVCARDDSQASVSRQLETLTRTVEELSRQVQSLQQKIDRMQRRGAVAGETRSGKTAPVPARIFQNRR